MSYIFGSNQSLLFQLVLPIADLQNSPLWLQGIFAVEKLQKLDVLGERVSYGVPAEPGMFPYMVAIWPEGTYPKLFCSGVLISDEWIMTTGGCISKSATAFWVVMGSTRTDDFDSGYVNMTAHYNVTIAPDGFLGLIQLPEPVDFLSYPNIKTIKIANWTRSFGGLTALLPGWGLWNGTSALPMNTLYYGSLRIVDDAWACLPYEFLICANPFSSMLPQTPCNGDQGTPLIVRDKTSGEDLIVGLSLITHTTCPSFGTQQFSRPSYWLDWIQEETGLNFTVV